MTFRQLFYWAASVEFDGHKDQDTMLIQPKKEASIWQIAKEITGKGSRWKDLTDPAWRSGKDRVRADLRIRVPTAWLAES